MTFSVLAGLKKFNIPHKFEVKNIYEYYAKWIREGKLNVNSDWNKDLKIKFTVQDPCQIVRKSFGDPIAEDLRFVVKTVVGEENFVEMHPNRSNNYCCTGGGGAMSMSEYTPQRLKSAKVKADQLKATGAKIVVTSCHNCVDGLTDLIRHYKLGMEVSQLVNLVANAATVPERASEAEEAQSEVVQTEKTDEMTV